MTVKMWRETYEAIPGDKAPMLAYFRGIYPDGQTLYITASNKALMELMECPGVITTAKGVLSKHFKYTELKYRITRQ